MYNKLSSGIKRYLFLPETWPEFEKRSFAESKYPGTKVPVLPEKAVVFCLGKGIPVLKETYPCYQIMEHLPGFITRAEVLGIENAPGICFLHGGRGAPQVACTVETLRVLGVKEILMVGLCGGFGENQSVGDILLPEKIWCEEGTSLHYVELPGFARVTPSSPIEGIASFFREKGYQVAHNATVTTDAVYRQTFGKERFWRQLGCVGVGVVDPGQAAIFGGSFWQYEFNTPNGKTDEQCRVRVNCHAVPNMWQYEALAFKPGLTMRWYRDAFCQEECRLAKEKRTDPYQLMNEQAEKIPAGCYGMMCTFSDVMNFIAWRHAAPTFTNFDFDAEKYNKYTFYRAIMENTALIARGHMDLVRESTGGAPQEVVFAGGASKGDIWCQILADVLGLPVKVPVVREATALGAAIIAGYGAGIYSDISSASRQLVKWAKVFEPNMEAHQVYDRMYGVWRKIYDAQLALSDAGITRYMWAAPGLQ